MPCRAKRENYVTVQGFMVTDLKLKGNELLIYAIIYGFSQAENQTFSGSLQYFADWTNSTRQGVLKSLKSLEEKGLIGRDERVVKGVKFVDYFTKPLTQGGVNSVYYPSTEFNGGVKLSLTGGVKQSLTHNIYKDNIEDIIVYINTRVGSSYKATTPKTKKLIIARLAEGFTVEDFKKVIDKKVADWKGTEFEKYLRPETLFGTKFEGYLNEKQTKPSKERYHDYEQRDYTEEEIKAIFGEAE